MVFNSLTFLAFFALVLALHHLPASWRVRKLVLTLASYLFYAAWNPPFVVLLWISTTVDWWVAKRLGRTRAPATRRALLLVSLGTNLGLLGFFKYGNFLLENFVALVGMFGIAYRPLPMDIVLPVGISFYTFQTLSYTIDVYRGRLDPWRSFLDFALFVSFFPQLVAGPIVRAAQFLHQCLEPKRANAAQLGWGMALLCFGLVQKVVLADTLLAPVVDEVYGASGQTGFSSAWLGTLAFSGQIFFDFAGYSNCAIGVALCLGFSLPDNFRSPYAAVGFSDFWRRWHISLSTWLRDYLYIPLGGNRHGLSRTQVNLMITMLLGGLWHGASWNFVVWGFLHGTYLLVERVWRALTRDAGWLDGWAPRFAGGVVTYLLVCIGWVFFRADSFPDALALLRAMVAQGDDSLRIGVVPAGLAGIAIGAMLVFHLSMRNTSLDRVWERLPWWCQSAVLAGLLTALVLAPGADRAFIYFQF